MKWIERISRALMLGFAWGALWIPVAVLIGTRLVDPDNSMDEPWFMVGLLPGVLSGALFASLAGIAAGRRTLGQVSSLEAAKWGAISGAVVGLLPFLTGDSQTGWQLALVVIIAVTVMSVISAVASVMLGRSAASGRDAGPAR